MRCLVTNTVHRLLGRVCPRSRYSPSALLCVLLFLLSTACTLKSTQGQPAVSASGSFSLFLQPLPQEAHRLTFSLSDLVALGTDGREVPLRLQQSHFEAESMNDQQKRLAKHHLPPGRYQGIALRVAAASWRGQDGDVALLAPPGRIQVEQEFTIDKDQSETLFLSLSAERLVTDEAFFTPQFTLWEPERILANLKGFVSNRGSQSLSLFNKRQAWIVGAIQVGKGPAGLVLDQRRGWLYIALAEENAIEIFDVNSGKLFGRVRLQSGDQPTELALSISGTILLALNKGSHSISIIDPQAQFETGRVHLVSEPSGIFIGPDETRAYVVHGPSSTITLINLQTQQIQHTEPLEQAPLDGVCSADGRTLYLINDFSADLTVLNATSLTLKQRIFIGDGALAIKADSAGGLLYIGKQNGEIAVVDPRAAMAIDTYTLSGPVRDLTIDNEENTLFAVLPQSGTLVKIDLISKQERGRMELEAESQAVVVMGER